MQGFGGPCCARILTSWFATKERGTYWGMWNIAHNLGGFGAPLLAGTAARLYGWKWGEPSSYDRQLCCTLITCIKPHACMRCSVSLTSLHSDVISDAVWASKSVLIPKTPVCPEQPYWCISVLGR